MSDPNNYHDLRSIISERIATRRVMLGQLRAEIRPLHGI